MIDLNGGRTSFFAETTTHSSPSNEAGPRPTPARTIGELGLTRYHSSSDSTMRNSWDLALDLAVVAYWDRRGKKAA